MGQLFRFRDICVDTGEEALTRGGERVAVNRRAFQVLRLLVERAGQTVTKQEFFDTVWADTFVEDNSLTVAITTLRKALGDDARDPKYIENIPRKGYRFIAEVESSQPDVVQATKTASSPAAPASRTRRTRYFAAAALLTALALAIFVVGFTYIRTGSTSIDAGSGSIAVVPFATADPDIEYLADGLTEGIADSLGELPGLRVTGRTSAFTYKSRHLDAATIGRELNVSTVLTGRIEIRGHLALISAELTDVPTGRSVWAKEYERTKDDSLAIRDIIARDAALAVRPGATLAASSVRGGTSDPEAYNLYLRAAFLWNKRTDIDNRAAADHFQRAINRDPAFALAWVGLATCYTRFQWVPDKPGPERNEIVVATARKALELAPDLGEAYAVIALSQTWFARDLKSAAANYQRAIELDPNDATARHWYAEFLAMQGKREESMREYDAALNLEPLSYAVLTDRALALIYARQYDQAISELERIKALNPDYQRTYHNLSFVHEQVGNYEAALAALDRFHTLQYESGQISQERFNAYKGFYRRSSDAARNAGAKGYWPTRLDFEVFDKGNSGTQTSPVGLAKVHARLGQYDLAFEYLERALEIGDTGLLWVKASPWWDDLRGDPRFSRLLERTGFDSS